MNKIKGGGTCLVDAFKTLGKLEQGGVKGAELIQGLVYGETFGFYFPHSWVELNGYVFDFSNGSSYLNGKENYYKICKPDKIKRFKMKQILECIE